MQKMYNKVKICQQPSGSCIVQAIIIRKNKCDLLIPSPFGLETMDFANLDEAIAAIKRVGYDYYVSKSNETTAPKAVATGEGVPINYDGIIEVFIKNLGHQNLEIRNSAIKSLSKFGLYIAERLKTLTLDDKNWLVRESAIKCMENIINADKNAGGVFQDILIEISDTENTMVKRAALKALEKICDNRYSQ